MSTRPSLQDDRLRERFHADMLRGLGIGAPASMKPSPVDDEGEPTCTDCGYTPVREEGDVCMGCRIDHAQMMRCDE